jgi:hypothetical protein
VPFDISFTERHAPSVGGTLKLLTLGGLAAIGAAIYKAKL